MNKTTRVWKSVTTCLLFALTCQLILQGFFREKSVITRKSDVTHVINTAPNNRKVIMLLVDALREDFVDFDEQTSKLQQIAPEEASYKGKKMSVMRDLRESFPEGTMLFPMTSASPTVTSVRVKNLVNGGISTFFEVMEEFAISETAEDNILFQVKNRPGG